MPKSVSILFHTLPSHVKPNIISSHLLTPEVTRAIQNLFLPLASCEGHLKIYCLTLDDFTSQLGGRGEGGRRGSRGGTSKREGLSWYNEVQGWRSSVSTRLGVICGLSLSVLHREVFLRVLRFQHLT